MTHYPSPRGLDLDGLSRAGGQYRIKKPIGRGGMGEVYPAEHTTQSREVALKILPAHFLCDGHRVQRFRQEARAALALNHPNVVTVYDIGESAGVHFISTEFVEGRALRERMASARLMIEEAVEIGKRIALTRFKLSSTLVLIGGFK